MMNETNPDADYIQIFGRAPEPWRAPLGALRLTVWDDDAAYDIRRARDEVEELVRVLND